MANKPKGVPATARLVRFNNIDWLPSINALLKSHGLRLRMKASQRGGGVPSWVWLEKTDGGTTDVRKLPVQPSIAELSSPGEVAPGS